MYIVNSGIRVMLFYWLIVNYGWLLYDLWGSFFFCGLIGINFLLIIEIFIKGLVIRGIVIV